MLQVFPLIARLSILILLFNSLEVTCTFPATETRLKLYFHTEIFFSVRVRFYFISLHIFRFSLLHIPILFGWIAAKRLHLNALLFAPSVVNRSIQFGLSRWLSIPWLFRPITSFGFAILDISDLLPLSVSVHFSLNLEVRIWRLCVGLIRAQFYLVCNERHK